VEVVKRDGREADVMRRTLEATRVPSLTPSLSPQPVPPPSLPPQPSPPLALMPPSPMLAAAIIATGQRCWGECGSKGCDGGFQERVHLI
jgi:hypothetical protein